MENYQRLQKLGSGNFAKVHLAVHIPTKTQVRNASEVATRTPHVLKRGEPKCCTNNLAVRKHISDDNFLVSAVLSRDARNLPSIRLCLCRLL